MFLRTVLASITTAILLTVLAPPEAGASTKYWVTDGTCDAGLWDDRFCWSSTPGGTGGAGEPGESDSAYLIQGDAIDRTVTYQTFLDPKTTTVSAFLFDVRVDATGTGTITFLQSQDNLSLEVFEIGFIGTGAFIQSGGTTEVEAIYLGYASGSSGTYDLSGPATVTLSAYSEIIGRDGTGEFTQSGGTNTIVYDAAIGGSGDLYLGMSGSGTYTLSGGTLTVGGDIVDSGGGATGTLNIDGGTLNVGGDISVDYLRVGSSAGTTGSYTLSDTHTVTADNEYIGLYGTGTFNQSGGTNTIAIDLQLGFYTDSSGTYDLSGGDLSAYSEYIGRLSTGSFIQSGGTNTIANKLSLNFFSGSSGTYDLQGGILTVANIGGTAEIANNDSFNYSGGTLNVDTFNNNAAFNLSGVGTRTVNGNVTNAATGTVSVTNTNVEYTGTFTNLGAYVSDPSDNSFTDLIIGDTGYLVGGAGDSFFIGNNFTSTSTMNTAWNTVDAYLEFNTGADPIHDFSLTGLDFGANLSGYTDNFAWGTLALAGGNALFLFDGNTDAGGALYLGEILGLALSGSTITNIVGIDGLNIYYNALLAGNTYLGGYDYSLFSGGMLLAINGSGGYPTGVPEPSTMLLLGTGLVGLGLVRKRLSA